MRMPAPATTMPDAGMSGVAGSDRRRGPLEVLDDREPCGPLGLTVGDALVDRILDDVERWDVLSEALSVQVGDPPPSLTQPTRGFSRLHDSHPCPPG
jgi:hypothetical protein